MDNRIFNINGKLKDTKLFQQALQLAFDHCSDNTTAVGWVWTEKHGIILLRWRSAEDKANVFPTALKASEVAPIILAWLNGPDAQKVECSSWDANIDHDGDNGPGWRIYVEDWGHVNGWHQSICAIKPAFMWYGK